MRIVDIVPPACEGARVVVLPGNDLCAEFYAGLGAALAARGLAASLFTVPGYDGTPAITPFGWAPLLDALGGAVREALGEGGILVGHSFGGLVALVLAARLPEVRRLVLLEPAVIPSATIARFGAWWYTREVFGGDRGAFTNRGPWYRRVHDPGRFPADVMARVLESQRGTDVAMAQALRVDLPSLYPLPFDRITAPTLLIRGGSSGPVMALGQRWLARQLRDARCEVVADAGHWLANEQDDALAALIATVGAPGTR